MASQTEGFFTYLFNNADNDTDTPIPPALGNNILCALLTVLYVNSVIKMGSIIRINLGCAEESRKFIHICAGCWILFWPMFDVTHWTWRLNILVPTAMSLKLFYKGAIQADPNDIDVQTMSRSSSPSELIYGPLHFTIFMMWLGLCKFMTTEGAILMAALGIGDGIAPLIGRYYGRTKYRFPLSSEKSLQGSIFGVLFGTIGGIHFFLYMLGLPPLSIKSEVMCGVIAMVVEATAPEGYDNIALPGMLHLSLNRILE